MPHALNTVAVVGAGLVGSGWALVFARGGASVRIFDASESIRAGAMARLRSMLEDMQKAGLVDSVEPVLSRITLCHSLEDAVGRADYIQESVLERVEVKQAACAEIDAAMRPDAMVGSSSSGIPASAFTEALPKRSRFLIAHPVNPPHLVPLVELVPAPWTDAGIIPVLRAAMEGWGQAPIEVKGEIEGFILNRLQGALLNEAWALYEAGLASAADIDRTVSEGLGLRWAFMGPFETIDLNAPGGIADYSARLAPLYHRIALSRRDPRPWSAEAIAKAEAERRQALPADQLQARTDWRNRRLMALVGHLRAQPK
ncbi:3-hydroxyacyl-CoA dehydrogenase [Pseudoroseomonas cervicalis]|uniref:3-hydroxyacyl-CoA dehydrogenase, NAD binding domain protein n=1 Tax=Pseudoroseomonas cervicalis ATCC 49957 TaxID=525371 RepID=D5RSH0_9PROT|nr:3-hydroxyacyl-CoA dehydrogenase [Pseudoroseomonas cervicalis]EFH09749.1 3-hydroxyacyl-CoA dehydrogenase, NAD binding domain protein [Pseudoroseomonas cervicalis ATCC 49957]